MSVSIGGGGVVNVYVHAIAPLKSGNLHADGSEQILVEHEGSGRISGYVDLSKMEPSDSIVIRQYVKILAGSAYSKYAEELYSGIQDRPTCYIQPRETDYGMKLTLQQMSGSFKSFPNNFVLET